MAVPMLYLIGKKKKKKREKFILDILHYRTFYVDKNIFSAFNESFQSIPYIWQYWLILTLHMKTNNQKLIY